MGWFGYRSHSCIILANALTLRVRSSWLERPVVGDDPAVWQARSKPSHAVGRDLGAGQVQLLQVGEAVQVLEALPAYGSRDAPRLHLDPLTGK